MLSLSLLLFSSLLLLIAHHQHNLLKRQGKLVAVLTMNGERERELLRECYGEVGWDLKGQIISLLVREEGELRGVRSEIMREFLEGR